MKRSNPLYKSILAVLIEDELGGGSGVTPYRIMRALAAYPSQVYHTIYRMEEDGLVERVGVARGALYRATMRGLTWCMRRGCADQEAVAILLLRRLGVLDGETLDPAERRRMAQLMRGIPIVNTPGGVLDWALNSIKKPSIDPADKKLLLELIHKIFIKHYRIILIVSKKCCYIKNDIPIIYCRECKEGCGGCRLREHCIIPRAVAAEEAAQS